MDLLTIRDLHLNIQRPEALYHILRGVNLSVSPGRPLGIVGESGSGKTITCLTIMRLLPKGSNIIKGSIVLDGEDLLRYSERDMGAVRGRDIGMIFQDARASLNPVLTVGDQIMDIYRHRTGAGKEAALKRAVEVLDAMGISGAKDRVKSYPHELSGGMCQRVLIAMALVSAPKLLIADEVTSGLDVGQTVVIKDGVVLAVEAFEGTDATIRRAGRMGGAGSVVVKVAKRGHDMRFDIPVVGMHTMKTLRKARVAALAVEAGRCILLERDKVIREAERLGIAVVALPPTPDSDEEA